MHENIYTIMWDAYKKGFKAYLQLEKSLSGNSVEAYLRDVEKFTQFLQTSGSMVTPEQVSLQQLQSFIAAIVQLGIAPTSQARVISGLRAFYKYCLLEQVCSTDPTILLEAP